MEKYNYLSQTEFYKNFDTSSGTVKIGNAQYDSYTSYLTGIANRELTGIENLSAM
jgi:hypothetical protein